MEMTSAEAKINDINMHYRIWGEGEPLLMIMGHSANADWWTDETLQPLAERYRVITFDNRGSGRTDKPEGPYSIAQMASDTAGLMDRLGWSSAHVMGASMGGMIAQWLALEYPERVRKLVLACTSCGGSEQVPIDFARPELKGVIDAIQEGAGAEDFAKALLPCLFPAKFMQENSDRMQEIIRIILIAPIQLPCFEAQMAAVLSWSDYSRLGDIKQPTLVMTGDEDILIEPENSRILADAIPDSRLVTFPGGGHGFFFQSPDRVAREVLDFLGQE